MPRHYITFAQEYGPNAAANKVPTQKHMNGKVFDNSEPCTNTEVTIVTNIGMILLMCTACLVVVLQLGLSAALIWSNHCLGNKDLFIKFGPALVSSRRATPYAAFA